MRVHRCKGSRDLSPEEMTRFRLVEGVFSDCCRKGGYQEIRTPTLEYLHLFTSTGTLTPGALGKVYSFLDWDGWSGERVVLRPDGTIPVARSYIEKTPGQKLAKLFYVANIFMFEETGKQAREKWQCGAELIGARSKLADVELVMLARETLERLGLENVELKLSHAGLMRALLTRFGLSADEQSGVIDRILDGDETVLAGLRARTPEMGETLTPLLDLTGQSPGFLRNLKAVFSRDLPEFGPALDNFIEIVDLLEALECPYRIDIPSGRGFEYYTGVMFQLLASGERVAGGGRYDALIPLMGGEDVPASGFALYIDRLMGMVRPEVVDGRLPDKVLIRSEADNVVAAFALASHLREAGFRAEMDLGAPCADADWLVDIGGSGFAVSRRSTGRESRAQTAAEVAAILGGTGGG